MKISNLRATACAVVFTLAALCAANQNVFAQTDVTSPGDIVTRFGGTAAVPNEDVQFAIDNTSAKYTVRQQGEFGSGLTVTPARGSTVVTGLRLYTANDVLGRDPTSYRLEGSNNNFATAGTLISTGTITLPEERNPTGQTFPTFFGSATFANTTSYASYRLTFPTRRGNPDQFVQVSEIELLGTVSAFTVDRPDDATTAGFDACTAAANDCTLRGAVARAATTAGDDTIIFAPGVTDVVLTSEISITNQNGTLTIQGNGTRTTAIRRFTGAGGTQHRIFLINNAAAVTINSVTIRDGFAAGSNLDGQGGGILRTGGTGTLSINDCAFINNTANIFGGGLRNSANGTVNIARTTFSGNVANGFIAGGAIDNNNTGTLNISNSTFSGNQSTGSGGSNGGAIYTESGTVTITNSTITNNTAAGSNSAGGIRAFNGTVTLRNTIVAANVNNSTTPDVTGSFNATGSGNNLIGNVGTATGLTGNGNQTGTGGANNQIDPRLDPLANNGGQTDTHALRSDSPAIDAGNNTFAAELASDQRVRARVIDGNNDSTPVVDIGSFELNSIPSATFADNIASNQVGRREPVNYTVTFSEPVSGVSLDDFINTGTAVVAFSNFAQTSSTVYTFTATPTTTGTLIVGVRPNSDIVDSTGNQSQASVASETIQVLLRRPRSSPTFPGKEAVDNDPVQYDAAEAIEEPIKDQQPEQTEQPEKTEPPQR